MLCMVVVVVVQPHLPLSSAISILQQVAAGVAHLHRVGMVHGNLRCSNVLVALPSVAAPVPPSAASPAAPSTASSSSSATSAPSSSTLMSATSSLPISTALWPFTVYADDSVTRQQRYSDTCTRLVVSDFLLAAQRLKRPSAGFAEDSGGGAFWLPPEALLGGAASLSLAADVFMFGGVLFEVLTAGRRPFFWIATAHGAAVRRCRSGGGAPLCTLTAAAADGVDIPWAVAPHPVHLEVLEGLHALMRACFEQLPSNRPTMLSVCQQLHALRQALAASPVADEPSV